MKKNLILLIFLPVLVFLFSCGTTRTIPKPLGILNTTIYQYMKDTTYTCSDSNIIEFQRGLDIVIIQPRTQCAVYVDTAENGTVVAKVYFGKDREMKILGDPFLLYCPDEENGELTLCEWSEHPDSVAYDSQQYKGSPKFWHLNKGQGAKILVDTTRNYYFPPGASKNLKKKN